MVKGEGQTYYPARELGVDVLQISRIGFMGLLTINSHWQQKSRCKKENEKDRILRFSRFGSRSDPVFHIEKDITSSKTNSSRDTSPLQVAVNICQGAVHKPFRNHK
jgi:hypothetical protein